MRPILWQWNANSAMGKIKPHISQNLIKNNHSAFFYVRPIFYRIPILRNKKKHYSAYIKKRVEFENKFHPPLVLLL